MGANIKARQNKIVSKYFKKRLYLRIENFSEIGTPNAISNTLIQEKKMLLKRS